MSRKGIILLDVVSSAVLVLASYTVVTVSALVDAGVQIWRGVSVNDTIRPACVFLFVSLILYILAVLYIRKWKLRNGYTLLL